MRSKRPEILGALSRLLDVKVVPLASPPSGHHDDRMIVTGAGRTWVIAWSPSAGAGPVSLAVEEARRVVPGRHRELITVVAVPFMGEAGREVCRRAGVAWLDLAGNASISAKGLHILVDGRPRTDSPRGRPPNRFAPRSSRIARWLLMNPDRDFSQREIARGTGITEGFVSRIVTSLEREGYLARNDAGQVRPKDTRVLLDAWREVYRFDRHEIHPGHIAARSGEALAQQVGKFLAAEGIPHAATGLAAAWLYTGFAGFRIATFYLPRIPTDTLRTQLAFRDDPRGANVWFVVPNDDGVYQGTTMQSGIRCVHPVQAYLDLGGHPERAAEAAEQLRSSLLKRVTGE